jgi:hypothetical protein
MFLLFILFCINFELIISIFRANNENNCFLKIFNKYFAKSLDNKNLYETTEEFVIGQKMYNSGHCKKLKLAGTENDYVANLSLLLTFKISGDYFHKKPLVEK